MAVRPRYFTLGEVAAKFGCETWQVRRVYERGLLPAAERVGVMRIVSAEDLEFVGNVLRAAGYIRPRGEAAA